MELIYIDTGALIALSDKNDKNHKRAVLNYILKQQFFKRMGLGWYQRERLEDDRMNVTIQKENQCKPFFQKESFTKETGVWHRERETKKKDFYLRMTK